jgi:hypothetical protein
VNAQIEAEMDAASGKLTWKISSGALPVCQKVEWDACDRVGPDLEAPASK